MKTGWPGAAMRRWVENVLGRSRRRTPLGSDATPRTHDIEPLPAERQMLFVDGQPVAAVPGETVICVLNAMGRHTFSRNDHLQPSGGYCWMGVCHACLVKIDGCYKRRACQTLVAPGMQVETERNRFGEMGLPREPA